MKTKIILSSLALATVFIFSCNSEAKKESVAAEQPAQSTESAAYVCPMHPDVKSDKPAQCSECGMDLEPVTKTDNESH